MTSMPDGGSAPPVPGGGGGRLLAAFDNVIGRVAAVADQLSALVCALLIVATTASVIGYQLDISFPWLDDVLRMLLIWLVYLGTVSLCLDNDHISMDALYLHLPPKARKAMDIVIAVMGIGLCSYIAKIGYASMMQQVAYGTLLDSGYLPAWPQSLAIPLCFALMAVAYLSYLLSIITGRRRRRQLSEEQRMAEGL